MSKFIDKIMDFSEKHSSVFTVITVSLIFIICAVPVTILFVKELNKEYKIEHLCWERHLIVEEYGQYSETSRSVPNEAEVLEKHQVYDGTYYNGKTFHRSYHTEYTYNTVGWHMIDIQITSGVDNEPYFAETEYSSSVKNAKAGDRRVREGECSYYMTFEGDDTLHIVPYDVWKTLEIGQMYRYKDHVGDYLEE